MNGKLNFINVINYNSGDPVSRLNELYCGMAMKINSINSDRAINHAWDPGPQMLR